MGAKFSDIPLAILKRAAQAATRKAKRENRKLGLSEVVVRDNKVVEIDAAGHVTVLQDLELAPVKVHNKKVKLGKKNS